MVEQDDRVDGIDEKEGWSRWRIEKDQDPGKYFGYSSLFFHHDLLEMNVGEIDFVSHPV